MVSIGGIVTNSSEASTDIGLPDPSPNGVGVFDMTTMQWTDSYNPNAAPYVTPDNVKAYSQQHGSYPSAWTSDVIRGWFTKAITINSTSQPQSRPASPPASPPTKNTGAIAGGIVGGIAAIILVGCSGFFYFRYRKHNRAAAVSEDRSRYKKPELSNNVRPINELNGIDRQFELPQKENTTSELNSEARPQELGFSSANQME